MLNKRILESEVTSGLKSKKLNTSAFSLIFSFDPQHERKQTLIFLDLPHSQKYLDTPFPLRQTPLSSC